MENYCLFCGCQLPPIEDGKPCPLKQRVCVFCWQVTDRSVESGESDELSETAVHPPRSPEETGAQRSAGKRAEVEVNV